MAARTLTQWLSVIESQKGGDGAVAEFLLGDLTRYRSGEADPDDVASVMAFIEVNH